MAVEGTVYQRLSRSHFGLNGTASLWLGSDHLLQVSNQFGWEQYRRWFYRDIQALIARRNVTRLVWNLVVGLGGLFIGFGAILVLAAPSTSSGGRNGLIVLASFLGVISVGFLAVALVNTLLGPSCTVYVQTPRGMEKLSAPGRLAVFERIVERVRPFAEEAQAQPGTSGLRDLGAAFDKASSP
jgi:hypothetical protein